MGGARSGTTGPASRQKAGTGPSLKQGVGQRELVARYYQYDDEAKVWRGYFWGYGFEVGAERMDCISIMGMGKTVVDLVLQPNISHFTFSPSFPFTPMDQTQSQI